MNVPAVPALSAVLFDLDGTLVDTIPHILASFRYATTEVLGAPFTDEMLLRQVGIPLEYQMQFFASDEETVQRLVAAYRTFNHATHDQMARLYPNTIKVLERIKGADIPMGVVTSKGRLMADRAIKLFDLGRYLSTVVAADDTTRHKPEPEPVLLAADLMGVEPSGCVYVGDSPADIAAGKAAGMSTVGASWGVSDEARIAEAGPDAVIHDIAELPALLGIAQGRPLLGGDRRENSESDRRFLKPR